MARSHFEVTWLEELGSKSPRRREVSARSHFKATWLDRTRLEVSWRSLGSRKLDSKSLWGQLCRENLARSRFEQFRGHLARDSSARSHFEITLLKNSKSLGSRNLSSKSLRGHLAGASPARSLFEAAWLGKARLEVTSGSLGSRKTRLEVTSRSLGLRKLGSKSLRGHVA